MKCVIRIRDTALEELVRCAWETKTIESIGGLFGKIRRVNNHRLYDIYSVHASQLAIRYPNSCETLDGGERSGHYFFYPEIGDFHSHPTSRKQKNGIRKKDPGRVYLSKNCDVPSLKETPKLISVVISVKRTKDNYFLKKSPYKLSVYLDDDGKTYRFDIGGYYFDNNKVRKARIVVSKRASKILWW